MSRQCLCLPRGSRSLPCSDDAIRRENTIRDHGGNIDMAQARFGGTDWIDLSTGINRVAFSLPSLPMQAWTALPTEAATARLFRCLGFGLPLSSAQPRLPPFGQLTFLLYAADINYAPMLSLTHDFLFI